MEEESKMRKKSGTMGEKELFMTGEVVETKERK